MTLLQDKPNDEKKDEKNDENKEGKIQKFSSFLKGKIQKTRQTGAKIKKQYVIAKKEYQNVKHELAETKKELFGETHKKPASKKTTQKTKKVGRTATRKTKGKSSPSDYFGSMMGDSKPKKRKPSNDFNKLFKM